MCKVTSLFFAFALAAVSTTAITCSRPTWRGVMGHSELLEKQLVVQNTATQNRLNHYAGCRRELSHRHANCIPCDEHDFSRTTLSERGTCRHHVSVRPSDTSRCSTKSAKYRITQITPYDSQDSIFSDSKNLGEIWKGSPQRGAK